MTPLPQFKGVPTDVVCTAEGKQFVSIVPPFFFGLKVIDKHFNPGIDISI